MSPSVPPKGWMRHRPSILAIVGGISLGMALGAASLVSALIGAAVVLVSFLLLGSPSATGRFVLALAGVLVGWATLTVVNLSSTEGPQRDRTRDALFAKAGVLALARADNYQTAEVVVRDGKSVESLCGTVEFSATIES